MISVSNLWFDSRNTKHDIMFSKCCTFIDESNITWLDANLVYSRLGQAALFSHMVLLEPGMFYLANVGDWEKLAAHVLRIFLQKMKIYGNDLIIIYFITCLSILFIEVHLSFSLGYEN